LCLILRRVRLWKSTRSFIIIDFFCWGEDYKIKIVVKKKKGKIIVLLCCCCNIYSPFFLFFFVFFSDYLSTVEEIKKFFLQTVGYTPDMRTLFIWLLPACVCVCVIDLLFLSNFSPVIDISTKRVKNQKKISHVG